MPEQASDCYSLSCRAIHTIPRIGLSIRPSYLLTNYFNFLIYRVDKYKKARISWNESGPNSRMLRGRNIGQGTCQHVQGMQRTVSKSSR